jgi:hypothetical protein
MENIMKNAYKAIAIILAFIILFSFSGCSEDVKSSEYNPDSQSKVPEVSKEPSEDKRNIFYINEHVQIGDIVITVLGVREKTDGNTFDPSEGNKYVAVDIEIHNINSEFESISSWIGFELQDSESYTYSISIMADNQFSLDGTIPPGMKMTGSVSFEIPESSIPENLIFDYDWLGGGQAIINLSEEKAVEYIKFKNPQETIEAAELGNTLEFSKVDITLNSLREDKDGGLFEPEEGMMYAIIDLTIENKSSESISSSSLMQIDVFDDSGHFYSTSLFAETKGSIEGEISPGQKKRGEVGFEVLEQSESLYMLLDYDWLESDPKLVKIK